MNNNTVRSEVESFAKRLKCSLRLQQDPQFLYFDSTDKFYDKVFVDGFPEVFRDFCALLREFDYIYFPAQNGQIGIGSLDILDGKRKQKKLEEVPLAPKIVYNEDDVLS